MKQLLICSSTLVVATACVWIEAICDAFYCIEAAFASGSWSQFLIDLGIIIKSLGHAFGA